MKSLTTFIFSLFLAMAIGQNAWQDAVVLNKYFEFDPVRFRVEVDNSTEVNETAILQIISKYCPEASQMTVEDGLPVMKVNLKTCFEGNPFISLHQYAQSDFSNILPIDKVFKPVSPGGGSGTGGRGGLGGGSLITNLADGLAIFLAKRTKEELNATFFEGLRKKMNEHPTYRELFPATFDLIYVIGEEIYNYNAYIESLREVFQKDLKVLPHNLRQYAIDNQFVKKHEYQLVMEDLLATAQMIFDGQASHRFMDYWAGAAAIQDSLRWQDISNEKTRKAVQDVAMSMKLLRLFTNSISFKEGGGTTWVAPETVSTEMRDISHVYLYLGLLWQQGEGLRFSNGTDFRTALGKLAKMNQAPISLRNTIVQLTQTGRQLEQALSELISNGNLVDAVLNEEYRSFAGHLFDLLEHARNLRTQIVLPDWKVENGKPTSQPKPDAQAAETDTLERKLFTVVEQLFDLEFNVKQEHYTLAVANLTRILTELLNKDDFGFKKDFMRHANFMATVAEAQNSQEVAAAIQLFALPPGSSRMKKQSKWSISLNSYGGLAYGRENDFNDEVDNAIENKTVFAPSAPLGIDLNKGLNNAGSLSLYAQLIDVGAIFAYRFSDETSQIPELKLQNIVAPGGYLIYGFGNNIPVSFGVGAQLGPNLRKIDPRAGLSVDKTSAWRMGVILSVDIPITHFYTN